MTVHQHRKNKFWTFLFFWKKNVIFFNFYFFHKKLMRTIRKLLGLGLNPSSTILVYASSFQNDNQTSSYCNAFFLRLGNMQGSQNVHRCVHMYTFMYICQLIIKGGFKPISIFAFFDFDVTPYLHFSPKTPQWGLKMTMRMFSIDF